MINMSGKKFLINSNYITVASTKILKTNNKLLTVYSSLGFWKVKILNHKRFLLYNDIYEPEFLCLDKYTNIYTNVYLENFTKFYDNYNPSQYIEIETKPGLWSVINSTEKRIEKSMFMLFNHIY